MNFSHYDHLSNDWHPVNNKLSQAIYKRPFTGVQFRMIECLKRKTYGYPRDDGRRQDKVWISYSELASQIGTHRDTARRILDELIKNKVIIQHSKPKKKGRIPGCYGINSRIDQWKTKQVGDKESFAHHVEPSAENAKRSGSTDREVENLTVGQEIAKSQKEADHLIAKCSERSGSFDREVHKTTVGLEIAKCEKDADQLIAKSESCGSTDREVADQLIAKCDDQTLINTGSDAPPTKEVQSNITPKPPLETQEADETEKADVKFNSWEELGDYMGREVFKKHVETYHSITGGPPVKLEECKALGRRWAKKSSLFVEVYKSLWFKRADWEAENGRKVHNPWNLLDKIDAEMQLRVEQQRIEREQAQQVWRPRTYHYEAAYDDSQSWKSA